MSTLFTVNQSPATGLLQSCQRYLKTGDAVLLLEDGVYCGLQDALPTRLEQQVSVYCLKEDLAARGLLEKTASAVQLVNYRGFVRLCTEFDKVVAWF